MFRRSANSKQRRISAAIFALAIAMPGAAMADPQQPLLMDPTYVERGEITRVAGCEVTVTALTDNRRAPDTIGIVAGLRAISAPADRETWFRSVVETGLRERGFTPTIALAPVPADATTPAPSPEVLTVRVRLQSVWLATLGMNKTGSVVLHMSAGRGADSHEGYYRGEYVSPNWASGRGEFNEHLDRTFAEALNALASDLAPLCAARPAN